MFEHRHIFSAGKKKKSAGKTSACKGCAVPYNVDSSGKATLALSSTIIPNPEIIKFDQEQIVKDVNIAEEGGANAPLSFSKVFVIDGRIVAADGRWSGEHSIQEGTVVSLM